MILVNVRCARCWSVLHQIESRPTSWEGSTPLFDRCRRCDLPRSPERLHHVVQGKGASGLRTRVSVKWADLRSVIERAQAANKPQDYRYAFPDAPAADGREARQSGDEFRRWYASQPGGRVLEEPDDLR